MHIEPEQLDNDARRHLEAAQDVGQWAQPDVDHVATVLDTFGACGPVLATALSKHYDQRQHAGGELAGSHERTSTNLTLSRQKVVDQEAQNTAALTTQSDLR